MAVRSLALLLALTLSAQTLQAECVREGRHKAREILIGVGSSVASAIISRTVSGGPGEFSDYREDQQLFYSPKYNRQQLTALAAGSALGIFLATPRGCKAILRVVPGVAIGTLPFWSTADHALGMRFSYAFAPPIQTFMGVITNSLGR